MTSHLGAFALERYSVEDLPPEEAEEAREHLRDCSLCQSKLATIEEQAAQDFKALPEAVFMTRLRERREQEEKTGARPEHTRWRAVWVGGALALAAAAGVWLWVTPAPKQADVITLRGQGVSVQRQRDGVVSVLGAGDWIRAGDALRVVVTLSKPDPVDVWFLDDEGAVDRPLTTDPVLLDAGEHALRDSAVVSEPCVDLWVVVGVGEAATRHTEAALMRLGPGKRDPSLSWLPGGCFALPLRCE